MANDLSRPERGAHAHAEQDTAAAGLGDELTSQKQRGGGRPLLPPLLSTREHENSTPNYSTSSLPLPTTPPPLLPTTQPPKFNPSNRAFKPPTAAMAITVRMGRRALLGLLLLGAAATTGRAQDAAGVQNEAAAALLDMAAEGQQAAADLMENPPPHMTPAAADWKSDAGVDGVSAWVGALRLGWV